MKIIDIKNSSGKITGQTTFYEDKIIISNIGKPLFIIEDINIIERIAKQDSSKEMLVLLYEEYTLSISEIASLYDRCYSNINKKIKQFSIVTNHKGRRNRAYGHPVSEKQSKKMSEKLKGRKITPYIRTPEIREKISKSLKEYFKEHPQNPEPHQRNWENGVYNKVNFKRGIAGTFYSYKNDTTFRFRSLLELKFMLLLEESVEVEKYLYEPFHIRFENGSSYLPDFLVNGKMIELKSKKFVNSLPLKDKNKLFYKFEQAKKYCDSQEIKYMVVYDEDIDFNSSSMKRYLNANPHIITKYRIVFEQPERMVIK